MQVPEEYIESGSWTQPLLRSVAQCDPRSRSRSRSRSRQAGQSPLQVRVRLCGGTRLALELAPGSPLLEELLAAAGRGPAPPADRVLALPVEPGTTAHVPADRIAAVELPRASRPDLHSPPIETFCEETLRWKPHMRYARKVAQELLEPYDARSEPRRRLLRELCDAMGGGPFAVLSLNAGFEPMLRNWLTSCDRHAIGVRANCIVFPMDEQTDRVARELGLTTFFDAESLGPLPRDAVEAYGDSQFARFVLTKEGVLRDMLQTGCDFLFQDADLVWFEDPLPGLAERASARNLDCQFMRDMNPRFQPHYYNSGFAYVRSNEFTRFTWDRILEAAPEIIMLRSDQMALNAVVSCLRERGLRTARLPDRYVDGEILANAAERGAPLPEEPIVAHANWTANLAQKVERLKKLDMWYLD